jgi:hypothetical protein
MVKVIAIGDVHTDWALLYGVLKASFAMDAHGNPTPPVLDGRYRVILMGDLVHPKTTLRYEELTGREGYDFRNPDHLKSASRAQTRELYKIKEFVEKAEGNIEIILGNHDDAALEHKFLLGNAMGVIHAEFDPSKGGTPLPDDLQEWMRGFKRYIRIDNVHFSHAGPLPGMMYFDDFFYNDRDSKHWWHEKPFYVKDAGHSFGVYGHTVMKDGIVLDLERGFAMIDALEKRQYLEMLIDDEGQVKARIASF